VFYQIVALYFVLGCTVLLSYLLWCKFTLRRSKVSLFHLLLMLGPIGGLFLIVALLLYALRVMISNIRNQPEAIFTMDLKIRNLLKIGENMNDEHLKEQQFIWMKQAVETKENVPLETILESSFYYPSSGFDGEPVRCFSHLTRSFVYVDYGIRPGGLDQALKEHPFGGYRIAFRKDGYLHTLFGIVHGEDLVLPPEDRSKYHFPPQPHFVSHLIFKRTSDQTEDHGPEYFSLLYIGGEGVATYQVLYTGTGMVPRIIGIIQPGTSFGGNWTNFCDPEQAFAKCVFSHPAGLPEFIVHGGWDIHDSYRKPIWPFYTLRKHKLRNSVNPMVLWAFDKKQPFPKVSGDISFI